MSLRNIEVVPYDPSWPQRFTEEKQRLVSALPADIAIIHHIGSTAVDGLMAKPIIDILLEVDVVERLDGCSEAFEALGYECMGEFGMPGRRYFRKGGLDRTHQIHAFNTGSDDALRHLAFRDYMRAFPAVAEEYVRLKVQVAAASDNDIRRYSEGKAAFVSQHEQRALKWYRDSNIHSAF